MATPINNKYKTPDIPGPWPASTNKNNKPTININEKIVDKIKEYKIRCIVFAKINEISPRVKTIKIVHCIIFNPITYWITIAKII
jgi:hypothetical protein